MTLSDQVRRVAPGELGSFQLMGEDLVLVTGRELVAAAERYRDELAALPAALGARLEAEQRALADEALRWLRRYNRSVHTRIGGYLALGFRLRFAYPWPVVATLGICQVLGGLARSHVYGLLGAAAGRLRFRQLESMAEVADDVLRRTNRGIFADSVPTVLYAMRAAELVRLGDPLGRALVDGPLPPLFDEESREIARGLVDGLGEPDPARRFEALGALTHRHFDREQAVFTHHMGASRAAVALPAATGWALRMTSFPAVPAAPSTETSVSRPPHAETA